MLILGGFILTGCASGQEKKIPLAIEPLRQASMAEQKSRINAFKKATAFLPIRGVILNLAQYDNKIENKKLITLLANLGINKVYIQISSLEELNNRLTLFLAQAKEKNISPEIYISLHKFLLPTYRTTFDKLFTEEPVNFPGLVKAIDNYISLLPNDCKNVNLTIQLSPHNFTSSFIANKRASLYMWSEENYGINKDSATAKAYKDFTAGKIDISTFIQVFSSETPFIPLLFREGMAYYSRELTYEDTVNEYELFANIYSWSVTN